MTGAWSKSSKRNVGAGTKGMIPANLTEKNTMITPGKICEVGRG